LVHGALWTVAPFGGFGQPAASLRMARRQLKNRGRAANGFSPPATSAEAVEIPELTSQIREKSPESAGSLTTTTEV
jgi:transposase-like protein